jgi:uncharacterized membrane protein YgcG
VICPETKAVCHERCQYKGVLAKNCQIKARKAHEAKLRAEGEDRRRSTIDETPVYTAPADYYMPSAPDTSTPDFTGGGGSGGGGGADGSW